VVNFVLNKHKELEFDKFYLCGPEDDQYRFGCLKEKRKRICYQIRTFTSSTQVNEIKDLGGHSKITIMVDDGNYF
jgi:ring-1,2-phenylacetyl-CoA epoxidase subunit PaaE